MEIKIFGKSLFEVKKNNANVLVWESTQANKVSKYLPDFYKDNSVTSLRDAVEITAINGIPVSTKTDKKPSKTEDKKVSERLSPKKIYELKMLNDESFKLNVNEKFINEQIEDFKDKLSLLKAEEYDMRNGVNEVSSVLIRMENRKKYEEVKDFFEEYPYTTTSRIDEVIKKHDYLKIGQIAQFVADMPKEAVKAMKDYNQNTDKICQKQAVFYIIADKKDFQRTNQRRDPILLAQSPFGHFWQILGVWDKEMLLLESL